jgi:hypothetical protein
MFNQYENLKYPANSSAVGSATMLLIKIFGKKRGKIRNLKMIGDVQIFYYIKFFNTEEIRLFCGKVI